MGLEHVRAITTKPRFLLATDLDHTLVQNEDKSHQHLLRFNDVWGRYFAADSLLVYSTGRSPVLFEKLWGEAPLLQPDVMICSVGSEIFYRDQNNVFVPDTTWAAHLDKGWDRSKVSEIVASFPDLALQAESEQRPHKASYLLQRTGEAAEQLLEELRKKLEEAGLSAKVVYSGGVDVDVLSNQAGKGCALAFLLQELREEGMSPTEGVQVNGDSGNDVELFQVDDVRGCVVANAHPELDAFYKANPLPTIYKSAAPCSGGIVEALIHFGTIPQDPLTAPPNNTPRSALQSAGPLSSPLPPGHPTPAAGNTAPLCSLISSNSEVQTLGAIAIPPAGICKFAAGRGGEGGTWTDRYVSHEVVDGVWVVVYQRLYFGSDGLRDMGRTEVCSAVLQKGEGGDGWVVRHHHVTLAVEGSACLKPVFVLSG